MIKLALLLIFVLCLCHRPVFAQAEGSVLFPMEIPEAANLFPNSFVFGVRKDSPQSSKKLFALELGPKLLELKASYFERPQEENSLLHNFDDPAETKWGKYADLLATASQFGGKLVGEAEAAYSTLGFPALSDEQPVMTRLGVHGQWGKTGYGLSYRSSGRGFVSPAGAKVDHARDEGQLWAEYDWSLFRVRGSVGEMWEENSETHQLTLTKTTATSFYFNKPSWSASLSSSYSTVENDASLGQKTWAVTNGLSLVYRFTPWLTLEPNMSFKQEWTPLARLKTDSPSAGFGLAYTPSRELRWTGRAAYCRDLSEDPLRAGSILNATTGVNWKLGRSFLGEQSVSLQLEYKNESRLSLPESQQANLTGTIQFKIAGF